MKKLKCEHLAGMLLVVLVLFPMLIKGIMCNDELLSRLWAQEGMDVFFEKTVFDEAVAKGRVLAVVGTIKFLSFFSDNKFIFGTINAAFLLLAIVLFGYLTYRLWKNKNFSVLLSMLILVFLPMNFEFAVPNAFVIVVLQPMILLELALIFYLNYLEDNKKKNMVLCIIMFMWAMFKYEFIITYVLVFPAIYVIKNYHNSLTLKKMIRYNIPIMVASIVYLMLYIGQRMIFPSNYSGTQMASISAASVIHVLKILFCSAFPTYYSYFNAKYRYLFDKYNHGSVRLENLVNPIIIVFVIMLVLLLIVLLKSDNRQKKENQRVFWLREMLIIGTILLYAVLPALPNALTPLYQAQVSEESFTSVPVSIYLYFAVMLLITYLLWNVMTAVNKKWLTVIVVGVITVGAVGNQIRNQVFVKEQVANYDSLVAIEDVLSLDYWKQYGKISISAPSLYETKNSLAIEEGHWTQYAAIHGNQLLLENSYDTASNANLAIQADNSFYLYYGNTHLLITKQNQDGLVVLKDVLGKYEIANVLNCICSEGKYRIYSLELDTQ